jgi:hypothetical protein
MTITDPTYVAYSAAYDGTRQEWRGLRKTQAVWRYHWLARNTRTLDLQEYGWSTEKDFYPA